MNGFERLKEQVKDQEDMALKQTVDYLLTRDDMEQKYLQENKTVEGMRKFIQQNGRKHLRNGWNYITNEVVYAWAVMYFSLPDKFLKINEPVKKTKTKKSTKNKESTKNNVVSMEKAKKELEKKKEITQLSLFGGGTQ